MKNFVVCHNGSRDNYLLAEALYESGLLEGLITDLYIPDVVAKFVKKRNNQNLDSFKVASNYKLFISKLLRIINYRQLDKQLSIKAFNRAIESKSNLFCYSYYGYWAFLNAQKLQFPGNKYLFQLHPHPFSVKRELDKVLSETSFKSSILLENEFIYGKDYLEELDSESKMADKIFTASSYTKQTLIENGVDESKIVVSPYGICQRNYSPLFKSIYKKRLNILFIGQPCQRKGLELLFKALINFPKDSYRLVITGRGITDFELLNYYKTKIEFDLKLNISNANKELLLQNSDLLVLPSYSEGFGHVLLEALSYGVPIITTKNTGAPDIFENFECGIILEEINVKELMSALELIFSRRNLLKEMNLNGLEKIKNFTYENFKNRIIRNL